MKELGPCIICRQKLSHPRNAIWKLNLASGNLEAQQAKRRNERSAHEAQEFFHIDCLRCKSSSFVMVLPGPFRAKAIIQTLTDLTKEDLARINALKEIAADEVLAFHQFLISK